MFGEHEQNNDYVRSRQPRATFDSYADCEGGTACVQGLEPVGLSSLMKSAGIGARCNSPIRAERMQQMQQTHGNRAVQRALNASGATRHISVQRGPMDYMMPHADEEARRRVMEEARAQEATSPSVEAGSARKGRTATSKAVTSLREGAKAATAVSAAGTESAMKGMVKGLGTGDTESIFSAMDKYDEAQKALEGSQQRAAWFEKHMGRTSTVGRGLRASNYGLQLWENLSKGQGVGESIFGAVAGGYMNNTMTSRLFSQPLPKGPGGKTPFRSNRFGPKMGWADTGVNLLNAGLNLIPGMPEAVTDFTQVAADATPTSFATSLASNAGRGLWNLGEGIFTGDWSGLKQQGEDITHGKAGAPLQGYGLAAEMISTDREEWGEITDEMRAGKRGAVPYYSLKLKDWVTDNVGGAINLTDHFSGPTGMEIAQASMRKGELIRNKDKVMKQYGPVVGEHMFTQMLNGVVPMPDYIK